MSKFTGKFGIDDGCFVGDEKIYSFDISENYIGGDMTDEDISDLYDELMEEEFIKYNITPYEKNKDEFMKWAKEISECYRI